MTALLTALLAAIPRALFAILAKIATDAFVQRVLEDVIVAGVKHLVANTTSSVDDQIAANIYDALGRKPDGSRKDA